MLNKQNIDWIEIWNTVHQTTTTLEVKSDIFSQIHLSFYFNYIPEIRFKCNCDMQLMWWEMKAHCHEILSCNTMLDKADQFTPIIAATDSKAISRRELILGLTQGDKSMNLRNMIIFTIRSCINRNRNVQFTSINNATSKLIKKVKAQRSRVI